MLRSRCSSGRRSPGVRMYCSNRPCSAVAVGLGRTTFIPMGGIVIVRGGQADADVLPPSTLSLVQNWFEELKRLEPVN